jgi:ABC-type lipopolysaccharide export system ATPase subunit
MLDSLDAELGGIRADLRAYLPTTRRVVRGYVLAALPGEVGMLGALAAGHGTTFYFCLGVLSLGAMVLMYMYSVAAHY